MKNQKKKVPQHSNDSVIPSKAVTEESMRVAATSLGDSFARVSYQSADLLAEASEMIIARSDAPDLAARGYSVTPETFDRIDLLARMLTAAEVDQELIIEDRKLKTSDADEKRARLLVIRDRLARIGEAAGLPESLFSVDASRFDTISRDMLKVIGKVRKSISKLPDQAQVETFIDEAKSLIKAERVSRSEGAQFANDRSAATRLVDQIKRLLFDELRHVSKQGTAAYPDDPKRDLAYRLDALYRKSKRSKSDSPVDPEAPVALEKPDVAA